MNISNNELSKLVKAALNDQGLSLESCCKRFNSKYSAQIRQKKIKPLNKDFLSRVTRNDFKVCSERISKLCEFLKIDSTSSRGEPLKLLSAQIRDFEMQAKSDGAFRQKYSAIFNFLMGLNLSQIQGGEIK